MRRRTAVVAFALVAAGCALAARDHPCWPFLAHQYRARLPPELVRRLARERGAHKVVRGRRAPVGFYWRPERAAGPFDEVRTVWAGYELAQCERAGPPGGAALPPRR